MKNLLLLVTTVCIALPSPAQTITEYEISFENAVHHEAEISVTFSNLEEKVLEVRMSRTSPGRYALHEFAKNVYNVVALDENGNELEITRPNPHQWNINGHTGTVIFEYTLYANRGDGTYSQVDETHAHLNIPATFAWARGYEHRPVEVTFNVRNDLNWKIATQLVHEGGSTYGAPDFYYFMDSPVEIADFFEREQMVDGQNIRLALHTHAGDNEVDTYFENVIKVVEVQRDIFGELPEFDYGEYTFLSCYMPNASGDGMEHRNSTVVTNSKPVDRPLELTSIGTVSHEFIHSWNIERIRPASLEPFNFEEANMSGELWFGEGFTSYYTHLTLVRAGIISEEDFIAGLTGAIEYVFNSPGRNYFNPIEMSYQAPFVDAARSVDPNNRSNTFISYYTYGSVLGLALDLTLRSAENNLTLDGYMQNVWQAFGKPEIPYTIRDIKSILSEYAGGIRADDFFGRYIYQSQMPDYKTLFENVGIIFTRSNPETPDLGVSIRVGDDGMGTMTSNAPVGSPLYNAGMESEDKIISIAGTRLSETENIDRILENYLPDDEVEIVFERWGERKTVTAPLSSDESYRLEINATADTTAVGKREDWFRAGM